MIFVRENLQEKVAQKLFGQAWGNLGKNPSHPKNLSAPTPMRCHKCVANRCPQCTMVSCPVRFMCHRLFARL